MTACSLAMTKHIEKFMPFLTLVYRDEMEVKDGILGLILAFVKLARFKMLSLCNHKEVLNLEYYCNDP
jgi:hypothetical protein